MSLHIPVLANAVFRSLDSVVSKVILDMTFGAGGHTLQILKANKNVKIFALDRDPVAHEIAKKMSVDFKSRLIPLLGKFSELDSLLAQHDVPESSVDGVLFDCGCSSMQLDESSRGFSLSKVGPLDMRMDGKRDPNIPTAADVLRTLNEQQLAQILKTYGDEKAAKVIARGIVEARYMFKDITTTTDLATLIDTILDRERRIDKLQRPAHTATKTFQALRMFVNNEVNELNRGIELAHRYLRPGGRLVTLTFHSIEDRIVKRNLMGIPLDEPFSSTLSQKYRNCGKWHSADDVMKLTEKKWELINRHVIIPSETEVQSNPRSRSAKLRAAFKR